MRQDLSKNVVKYKQLNRYIREDWTKRNYTGEKIKTDRLRYEM